MKLPLSQLRKILLLVIISVGFFAFGYLTRDRGYNITTMDKGTVTITRDTPEQFTDVDFALFWDIWDTLELNYFDPTQIDQRKLVYGAIEGMVAAVGDPYTTFLPPAENKVAAEDLSGSFEGVGIQIGFKGNQLAVVAPLPGSPAEEAGVEAGDFIIGIRDEDKGIDRGTVGITLPEAVQAIRGPAGTKVTLALLRDGNDNPLIVDVERRAIEVPSVELSFVGENENVAHLAVFKFGEETNGEWDKAVLEILKKQDLNGIIIDVRSNPGGYLYGAVQLGADFMDLGSLVVSEERQGKITQEYKTTEAGKLIGERIVVLINGGSASASEILAGALRDNLSTQLIGQKSFGKGTIQERSELPQGVALHITTAKWLTPNGTWVHENGLTPDYEVEDNPETEEDEQLLKAIEVVTGS